MRRRLTAQIDLTAVGLKKILIACPCPEMLAVCHIVDILSKSWTTLGHYLEPIVRPTPKLHLTVLIVKRKPGDVYQTCRFENARRDVCARSSRSDNNIGGVRSVKRFTGTERELNTQFRSWWSSSMHGMIITMVDLWRMCSIFCAQVLF